MIQDVIDAVISNIRTEYDADTYEIYTESVKQGLATPCFTVICVNPGSYDGLGRQVAKSAMISISYFPDTDEPLAEIDEVTESLLELLRFITVDDGLVYTSNIEVSPLTDEDMVQITATYTINYLRAAEEAEAMETLEMAQEAE